MKEATLVHFPHHNSYILIYDTSFCVVNNVFCINGNQHENVAQIFIKKNQCYDKHEEKNEITLTTTISAKQLFKNKQIKKIREKHRAVVGMTTSDKKKEDSFVALPMQYCRPLCCGFYEYVALLCTIKFSFVSFHKKNNNNNFVLYSQASKINIVWRSGNCAHNFIVKKTFSVE